MHTAMEKSQDPKCSSTVPSLPSFFFFIHLFELFLLHDSLQLLSMTERNRREMSKRRHVISDEVLSFLEVLVPCHQVTKGSGVLTEGVHRRERNNVWNILEFGCSQEREASGWRE